MDDNSILSRATLEAKIGEISDEAYSIYQGTRYTLHWLGQDMMDYAAQWSGAIWFSDEKGNIIFSSPKGTGLAFDIRGICQFPESAFNAIGYCNQVTVVGGNPDAPGTMSAGSPTSTNMQEAVGLIYTTPKPSDEEIAKYGWIPAPIVCVPSLTTKEAVKEAEKRLKYYKKNQNVVYDHNV